jgi:hypothetical protein
MKWTRVIVAALGLFGAATEAGAQELVVVDGNHLQIVHLATGRW